MNLYAKKSNNDDCVLFSWDFEDETAEKAAALGLDYPRMARGKKIGNFSSREEMEERIDVYLSTPLHLE